MPYRVVEIGNNQSIELSGYFNVDTVKDIDKHLRSIHRYSKAKYHIWDFRKVEVFKLNLNTAGEFPDINSIIKHWSKDHKIAVIPNSEGTYEDYLAFIESIRKSTGWQCKLFAEMQDAVNWCEI